MLGKVFRQFSSQSNVTRVGIVGAGWMGTGIGIVSSAIAKYEVIFVDINSTSLSKSEAFIHKWCKKQIEKQKLTEKEMTNILGNMQWTSDIKSYSNVDIVIEAINEDFELKKVIFKNLASVVPTHTILATNTAITSITKLAGTIPEFADRVIGLHFMNPVHDTSRAELIRGLKTSDDTHKQTLLYAQKMGKICSTALDTPGFMANRFPMTYINEAIIALQEGVGTVEYIDKTLKLGPMGPLTLADFIGLDTCVAIMQVLNTETGECKYKPCPLLVNYVNAGRLGRKTGHGFYNYNK